MKIYVDVNTTKNDYLKSEIGQAFSASEAHIRISNEL